MKNLEEIKYQHKKLLDRFLFVNFWTRKKKCIKKPISKAILVIRLDAIGDCIIWLDQAKEYRKAFPEHRLVLLHNKVWNEIAGKLPWFDEFIPFDRNLIGNTRYYLQLLARLNKYTYEKVISPVFSRDFVTTDWIIHNVNALEKIGYEGDYQNNGIFAFNQYYRRHSKTLDLKPMADKWYTSLVPNDSTFKMELQRNAHFIRNTINKDFKSRLPKIPFEIPKYKDIPTEEFALFFLGASTEFRMWSVSDFVKVSQRIPYNTIVLCGSPKEQTLALEFISSYHGDKKIIDLTGKTSLLDLVSVIANAKMTISNETSASHIAVATRTPSICLLGGGHYGRFHPYKVDTFNEDEKKYLPVVVTAHDKSCFNCNWGCKYPLQHGRWKCINDIKVDDVFEAIDIIKSYGTIL